MKESIKMMWSGGDAAVVWGGEGGGDGEQINLLDSKHEVKPQTLCRSVQSVIRGLNHLSRLFLR